MEGSSSSLGKSDLQQGNGITRPLISTRKGATGSIKKETKERTEPQKNPTDDSTKTSNNKAPVNRSSPLQGCEEVIRADWCRQTKYKLLGVNDKPLLPVDEDVFFRDMLSENPIYKSISQLRSKEYWEEAAAMLPPYMGPSSAQQAAMDK